MTEPVKPLSEEEIASLERDYFFDEDPECPAHEVVHDVRRLLAIARDHARLCAELRDATNNWHELYEDYARLTEEIASLRAELAAAERERDRIREAARGHLIGFFDPADYEPGDGTPTGYCCIHCNEIGQVYPTEAEIPHKPDCALYVAKTGALRALAEPT